MSRPYTLGALAAIVRRNAPVLYLHDQEAYLPSSVEWYLERATLVARSGERVPLAGGGTSPQDRLPLNHGVWPLADDRVADYWLEVPDAALAGDVASARSYVSIRTVEPGFLDISHWFWYPGNGCGTARVRTLAFDTTLMTDEAIPLTTLGFHASDWEKVTVRVTDDEENRLHSVYFAQHGGGHWIAPEQLEREPGGAFAAYASKNGHASYPAQGPNYTAHIKTAPPGVWAKLTPAALETWLRNDTMKGTRKVDCAASHEIVSIQDTITLVAGDGDAQADGGAVPFFGRVRRPAGAAPVLDEPAWLQFPYRWGPETEQKITHELMFEALKMAIGPLAVYGALTVGAALPLLGAVAGLLVPVFVRMENESGKPGPKQKYTAGGVIDEEAPPEPENLFHEAVGGALGGLVDWVEAAGRDVAGWTVGAADEVSGWTTHAAEDTAAWFTGAGEGVAGWSTDAASDVASWTTGAAGDAASWTTGAAETVATTLDPRNW